jgi:hypothetical protein
MKTPYWTGARKNLSGDGQGRESVALVRLDVETAVFTVIHPVGVWIGG